jgi:hypothetical protein
MNLQNNSGSSVYAVRVDGKIQTSGTAPTVSACGTGPSITGNDVAGKVTIGSGGVVTSCTLTFTSAYTTAPSCVITGSVNTITYSATTTTGVLTINASAAAAFASTVVSYICTGY